MPPRRASRNTSLAAKSTELALAAPQVVAHRLARMARAELPLSLHDQQEFLLMGTEKVAAFYESWNAMAWQAVRANQGLMQSYWTAMLSGTMPTAAATALHLQDAAVALFGQGLAPVHRRAVANARRLARIKPK